MIKNKGLGDLIREFKKRNLKKDSIFKNRKVFSFKGLDGKNRLIFLVVFFLIFSLVSGFYIIHLIYLEYKNRQFQSFKKTGVELSSFKESYSKRDDPGLKESMSMEKGEPSYEERGSAGKGSLLRETKSLNPKKETGKRPFLVKGTKSLSQKRDEKKLKKKIKMPKKEPPVDITISPSGFPILRERELSSNILLNAEAARQRGDYHTAIKFYEEYLKYRENLEVLNNLGASYLMVGEYQKAKEVIERALKKKKDPYFEVNYLLSLYKLGEIYKVCDIIRNKTYPLDLEGTIKELRKLCP